MTIRIFSTLLISLFASGTVSALPSGLQLLQADIAHTPETGAQWALVIFALLIALVPFVIAIFATREMNKFRKVAFGKYREAADRLLWAILSASTFTIIVIFVGMLSGVLLDILLFPPTLLGIAVWMLIASNVVTFTILLQAARVLKSIVSSD